jgi:oxygen-independent coproporphyrinogen III oxidase
MPMPSIISIFKLTFAVKSGHPPTEQGVQLTQDDISRQFIIMELMCQFSISRVDIEHCYHLDFDQYFAAEIRQLKRLEDDDLVNVTGDRIQITPIGRLLVSNVASVFDGYLHQKAASTFSKSI